MGRYSPELVGDYMADFHQRSERHANHPHFSVEVIDLIPAVDYSLEQIRQGSGTLDQLMAQGVRPRKVLVCSIRTRRERWVHVGPGELRLAAAAKLRSMLTAETSDEALMLKDEADELSLESRGVVVLRALARLTNGPVPHKPHEAVNPRDGKPRDVFRPLATD